jgi:predicted house-cleaning noncanonical NTP pyrophosphatase (MazG superfamily)
MEKLIRQDIPLPPEVKTRKASNEELDKLLGAKLVEEAQELAEVLMTPAPDLERVGEYKERKRRLIDEAADVLEVLNTILHRHGIDAAALGHALEAKCDARGGFIDRVLVED